MAQFTKVKGRKDKYRVRVFLGCDPGTGKRQFHNATVDGPRKTAVDYARDVERRRDQGTFNQSSKVSLADYLTGWLERVAVVRVRPTTLRSYECELRLYVSKYLGGIPLVRLRPEVIQQACAQLLEKGIAARTIRYAYSVLSTALNHAVKLGMIPRNPVSLVELPRFRRTEREAFSIEGARAFLDAAARCRFKALYPFAMVTGLRPGEYLGLQWSDLQLVPNHDGMVTVQRALAWKRGGRGAEAWHFDAPKTSLSRRQVPIPAPIVNQLLEHKRAQSQERFRLGRAYTNHNLVFANERGGPMRPNSLTSRYFKPLLKAAGLPASLRLYDLRHGCATLLLAAGEHPKIVSERLGHASTKQTLDTYSHVLPTMQKGATEKLERMLFGESGTNSVTTRREGNG